MHKYEPKQTRIIKKQGNRVLKKRNKIHLQKLNAMKQSYMDCLMEKSKCPSWECPKNSGEHSGKSENFIKGKIFFRKLNTNIRTEETNNWTEKFVKGFQQQTRWSRKQNQWMQSQIIQNDLVKRSKKEKEWKSEEQPGTVYMSVIPTLGRLW
jgi:hypothetical protein